MLSGVDSKKAIRTKTKNWFPFRIINFRKIPRSLFEGTMSILFYEPFVLKLVDYANTKLRELDIWLWIVEDRRTEQVYEIVR